MKKITAYFTDRASPQQLFTIVATATVPLHFWAFFTFFEDLNTFFNIFHFAEIWGFFSYTLFYVVLEIIGLTIFVLIPIYLIPKNWIRGRFTEIGLLIVIEVITIAIIVHNYPGLFSHIEKLFWFAVLLAFLTASVSRFLPKKSLDLIANLSERLLILSFIFWTIDFMGFITIVIRNF
jgi:hypothetical protein